MNLKFWKRKMKGLPLVHTMEDVRKYVTEFNDRKIKEQEKERVNDTSR